MKNLDLSMSVKYMNSSRLCTRCQKSSVKYPLGKATRTQNWPWEYHVICQREVRSASACQFLQRPKINVTNAEGGMNHWPGDI